MSIAHPNYSLFYFSRVILVYYKSGIGRRQKYYAPRLPNANCAFDIFTAKYLFNSRDFWLITSDDFTERRVDILEAIR